MAVEGPVAIPSAGPSAVGRYGDCPPRRISIPSAGMLPTAPLSPTSSNTGSASVPSVSPSDIAATQVARSLPRPARRPQPASPLREIEDYFGLKQLVKALPETPDSVTPASPRSPLPFPSRPSQSRPVSRASPSVKRRSLGSTPPTSPSSFVFPQKPAEDRGSGDERRMAAFLDKTAAAMEGGKSLAMVLPPRLGEVVSPEDEGGVTFLEALAFEENANTQSSGLSASVTSSSGDSPFPGMHVSAQASSAVEAPNASAPARAVEKRKRVILELLDTERSHAVDMAVVRDIYLARARGAHLTQIADHVMSSGLGLHRSTGPVDHAIRKRSSVSSPPPYRFGQPSMSEADIETVFVNLEEVAALAEDFSDALSEAVGPEEVGVDDSIGRVFLEKLPRIQEVSSRYCVRHHRAIVRLQELEPILRTYLSECSTLSHGRTTAWDLASLLIKPVQRCLKYPLLLDQLLTITPESHSDRPQLQRAYSEMLLVAEHINENKKRTDLVEKIVAKDKSTQRRDSARSVSDSLTKKLRRTSQRTRNVFDPPPAQTGDAMFDALVALLHSTRTGAQRFCQEMREWADNTRTALEAQVRLVEGWIEMYAPLTGERMAVASHERLVVFLDRVLLPIINGPWTSLDEEIQSSLFVKAEHLLSLFDNPLQVISKRNDKALDHARYQAKKQPVDKRGSEEYSLLTAQLSEELPRFLGSVSRYFNIIVSHFASAQAAYNEAVRERWDAYSERWITRIPPGSPKAIQTAFETEHQPFNLMMQMLATGLGVAADKSPSSDASRRPATAALATHADAPKPLTFQAPVRRESQWSTVSDRTTDSFHRLSESSTPRTSITSTSSEQGGAIAQSMAKQRSEQGSRTPLARQFDAKYGLEHEYPRRPASNPREPVSLWRDQLDPIESVRATVTSEPISPTTEVTDPLADYASHLRPQRADGRRDAAALRSRYLSQYSVVLPSDGGSTCSDESVVPLYLAEAVNASRSSSFRSGFPILSFNVGDQFEVEYEEADRAEGGSGWLLGRKPHDRANVGWARTEDFVLLEDVEEDPEAEDAEEDLPFAY